MFNKNKIIYIIENATWSIYWDGYYITRNLPISAKIDTEYKKYKRKIIHFGSRNAYLKNAWKDIHSSNIFGFTYFHGSDKDKEFTAVLEKASEKANFCLTSCELTKLHLMKYGVPKKMIKIIPLGVDLNIFKQISSEQKEKNKKENGIPENKIVIGSFQKDGVGWGEGNIPKLIKGPDILCDAIEKIAKYIPVFVLLTGPARGYVKKRLKRAGIPFLHKFVDYIDMHKYYSMLDFYIISSRLEGGPKAILEAWATGVPVVSAPVGMVPDIAQHKKNVLFVKHGDIEEICTMAEKLLTDNVLKSRLINEGLNSVKKYSWENIAVQYYKKIYEPIIKSI